MLILITERTSPHDIRVCPFLIITHSDKIDKLFFSLVVLIIHKISG